MELKPGMVIRRTRDYEPCVVMGKANRFDRVFVMYPEGMQVWMNGLEPGIVLCDDLKRVLEMHSLYVNSIADNALHGPPMVFPDEF